MKFVDILNRDHKFAPYLALLFSVVIILLDLLAPIRIVFSIFFVIPVLVAAWFNSLYFAVALSISLPAVRLLVAILVEKTGDVMYSGLNAVDRLLVLSVVALVTHRLSESMKHLKVEVKVLEGMIPICSNCKKIRDKDGEWQSLEKYLGEHSQAEFTHGICPDCRKLLYGEYLGKS